VAVEISIIFIAANFATRNLLLPLPVGKYTIIDRICYRLLTRKPPKIKYGKFQRKLWIAMTKIHRRHFEDVFVIFIEVFFNMGIFDFLIFCKLFLVSLSGYWQD